MNTRFLGVPITCVSVVLLVLIGAKRANAFRAEEGNADVAYHVPKAEFPVSAMKRDQVVVAQMAQKAGITVRWNVRLATPVSVRGRGLGRRQALSGGKGLSLRTATNDEQMAVSVLDNLSRFYSIVDAEKEFLLKRVQTDELGFSHVRLNQLHRGLRVVGAELIVHFDRQGDAYEVNGQYVSGIAIETTPKLTEVEAIRVAQEDLKRLGLGEVRWGRFRILWCLREIRRHDWPMN